MDQIEKNKEELLAMMEKFAGTPLSKDSIRNLGTLMSAYKALCVVSEEERGTEPANAARAHTRMPPTA